jgi:hypothetical protein
MARTPVMAANKNNYCLKSSGKETGGCSKYNLENEKEQRGREK